ncbi:MAG TPA: FAD-dependent oxidoreductase [Ilumatobacteraceae bacterium]|jgi:thioredoxin reductase (NADPH)|nr:FAD-dependent oxidoreductase [Ilumatobacteraceae bacterium]
MAKPIILTVDDDMTVSQAITRDLRSRYADRYRIIRATSGAEALESLEELARRDLDVALIVSDHRMPGMTGIELLELSQPVTPGTKRVLLTAYADTDVAIRAINDTGLDHYLLKPWSPPEERLYPVLDDLLADWDRANEHRFEGVRVVGNRWSDRSYDTRMFLARNHVHYQWLELERDPEAQRLHALFDATADALPLVLLPDGTVLRGAGSSELAGALGLRTSTESTLYDLVVVGAGPAGLAAAVYAASEGLSVAIIERDAPGGQAGQSARIENYLGFPNGLSGSDLSHRATTQARRLGAEMVLARSVEGLEQRGSIHAVRFDDGSEVEARAVLVATGVSYRLLAADGLADFTGRGVYYGAAANDARSTEGDDVYIVGAANSAGQAALHIAQYARRVVMLVRGASLDASMSRYLVERVQASDKIDVRLETEVVRGGGTDHLEWLTLVDRASGDEETVETNWLYAFIGALPRTDWLGDQVARDERGFVLTGPDVAALEGDGVRWPLARAPFLLETSVPGVFAAGDVRRSSMKRVASAVGEGSSSVSNVHLYLETV